MALDLAAHSPIARLDLTDLGEAREVRLRGRGSVWIRDIAGPEGAPTVLLLHGLLATGDLNWATSYEELRKHFRVVAIDHQGHGRGNRTRATFRLERCADDAAALCRALGIERPIACGYSMGGPIAALLWRRHPDLLSGLVFAGTVRRFNGNYLAEKVGIAALTALTLTASTVGRNPVRLGSRAVLRRALPRRRSMQWFVDGFERHDPVAIVQAVGAIIGYDSRSWISEIDVPTSVVVTNRDHLLAPWRQRVLADSIPDAVTFETEGTHLAIVRPNAPFARDITAACLSVADRVGFDRQS